MKVKMPVKPRICLIQLLDSIRQTLFSDEFIEQARRNPNDFTRKRKLPIFNLICFMLNQVKSTTQAALDKFTELLCGKITNITQQGFSKARQKLRWTAIRLLLAKTNDDIYSYGYKKWHNYRISAIDGSKIQLPSDPNLKEHFGTFGGNEKSVTAQGSVLFDVLNNIVIDGCLTPISSGERVSAVEHISFLTKMPSFSNELIIFDRGYPSLELIQLLESHSIKYLMRVKSKFNIEIDTLSVGCHNFKLGNKEELIKCRVIKFKLPSNEIETLITNVFDYNLGINAFKELYFLRWPVEIEYNLLKNKLEIENFSTRTVEGIYQDFYISLLLSNFIHVGVNEAQPIIDKDRIKKKTSININQILME